MTLTKPPGRLHRIQTRMSIDGDNNQKIQSQIEFKLEIRG